MTMSEIMIHSAFILLHIIVQSHLNMPSEFCAESNANEQQINVPVAQW